MPVPDPESVRPLLEAVSFAARAHRHQVRKDGQTPYAAHVVRVCLIVRHVFGIDDPEVLAAALLHDAIEDTATDYDDLAESFGPSVAGIAAVLTKDMRLPHDEREAAYEAALAAADWRVKVCKLADLYDNVTDSRALSPAARVRTLGKSRRMLAALEVGLPPQARAAFEAVSRLLDAVGG
jgi:(p)ppGpp synthase/HD superfamily hydrolase